MSPVVEREQRGIPVLGWCAIACAGCAVVVIGVAVVFGLFIRNTVQNMSKEAAVAPATRSGAGPLREEWHSTIANTVALACAGRAAPGAPAVFVLHREGGYNPRIVPLDAEGGARKSFPVGSDVSRIEVGRRGKGSLVLAFARLGRSDVDAYEASGKHLWTYPQVDMATSACSVDLGDPAGDAIAIGYNGRGGLHLLNPDGSPRWTVSGPGNIGRVTSARTRKGAMPSIICAAVVAMMEIYDSSGQRTAHFQTGMSLDQTMISQVVAGDLDGDGVDEILTAGRKILGGETSIVVRDATGKKLWERPIGRSSVLYELGITTGRFVTRGVQVAVSGEDGTITVLDAQGKALGKHALGARIVGLRTLRGAPGQPDRLVAATASGCACFVWRVEAR
jgi:hypothetical protein